MHDTALIDDFGRRTVFTGQKLVEEHTDTSDGHKPQWIEIGVWRTVGGSYVVQRTTCYRIIHRDPGCSRLEGYSLKDPTDDDTYPCRACNQDGFLAGGYAQADRITVEAYHSPEDLIESFRVDGKHTQLARAILAELSEKDEAVNEAWNTVVVP